MLALRCGHKPSYASSLCQLEFTKGLLLQQVCPIAQKHSNNNKLVNAGVACRTFLGPTAEHIKLMPWRQQSWRSLQRAALWVHGGIRPLKEGGGRKA